MIYLVSNVIVLGLLLFLSYILWHQAGTETNARTFLFALISMVAWTFIHLVIQEFDVIEEDFLTPAITGRLTYVAGLGLSVGLVIFAYYFPYRVAGAKTVSRILTGVFMLGSFIGVTTPLLFDTRYGDYGPGYVGALSFIAVLLLWSISIFVQKLHHAEDNAERRQLSLFVTGLLLTIGWGIGTNILFPIMTGSDALGKYGPLGLVFLAVFTIYAIFMHRLFNVRLLLAEMFLGVIAIVLLILTATSNSIVNFMVNGLTLGIYFVVAYYLYQELLERYDKEQQLSEKNDELRLILETKDDFLRMVSHQLRTPMTSLSGFLSMLVDKQNDTYELNEGAYAQVVRVYINAQRLSSVVNDILFTNALNADKFGVSKRAMNIKDILDAVVSSRRTIWEFYQIDLTYNTEGEDFGIRGDPMKLKEALNTLVDNGIYYGDTRVRVDLRATDSRVEVRVEDDGIGITEQEEEYVWNKFKRSEEAKRRIPNGSGLALHVTHATVKRHGGDIWFESDGRGEGATFVVELPKDGGDAHEAVEAEETDTS